jgi:hypothetical protein
MVYFDDFLQQSPQVVYHLKCTISRAACEPGAKPPLSTSSVQYLARSKPEPGPTYEAALPYPKSVNHAYALPTTVSTPLFTNANSSPLCRSYCMSLNILYQYILSLLNHNTLYQYQCLSLMYNQ